MEITTRSPKRHRQREPTTLVSVGDDMLAEILRRLQSLPSLASAAFSCPRLLSVACTTVAKDRFTSPAPLLVYFISGDRSDIPSFHRALRRSDPVVARIVRRGDFYLADFKDYDWRLMDCRQGLLLLTSRDSLAVFDPVSGSRLRIRHHKIGRRWSASFHCCFLSDCGGGDGTSFRVLCLESTDGGRVRPHVFSSTTGKWCSHSQQAPKGIKAPRSGNTPSNLYQPMHAGGRIYWRTISAAEMLTSLDVVSMEFSHVPLPDERIHSWSYALGDMEDGTTCIVLVSPSTYCEKIEMRVWFLKEEDGSCCLSWERQWRVDASEIDRLAGPEIPSRRGLTVYNITAGVVLLSLGHKNNGLRYLAFRVKDILLRQGTTKTDTKLKGQSLILAEFCSSTGLVHPYFMAWPRPTLKAAPASAENASTIE